MKGSTNAATHQELAKLPMAIVELSSNTFTVKANVPASTTQKNVSPYSISSYDVGFRLHQVCPILVQQKAISKGGSSLGTKYEHVATLSSTTKTFGDAVQTNLPAGSVLLVSMYGPISSYDSYFHVFDIEAVVNDSGTLNDITLPTEVTWYTSSGNGNTNYNIGLTYDIRGIVSLGR